MPSSDASKTETEAETGRADAFLFGRCHSNQLHGPIKIQGGIHQVTWSYFYVTAVGWTIWSKCFHSFHRLSLLWSNSVFISVVDLPIKHLWINYVINMMYIHVDLNKSDNEWITTIYTAIFMQTDLFLLKSLSCRYLYKYN